VAQRLLPDGTPQRRLARFTVDAARATRGHLDLLRHEFYRSGVREPRASSYPRWLAAHKPTRSSLAAQRAVSDEAIEPIAVECFVLHRDEGDVDRTLRSLRDQSWAHWTAIVVGNDSTSTVSALDDARINVLPISGDAAVAELNSLLATEPRRDFVVFVEAGDVLSPDAFFEIAHLARQNPLLDVIYWDDDLLDRWGRHHDPRFRPAWSPDMLLGADYIGTSFAIRHRRFLATAGGGLRAELGDAAWWDLLLRADLDHTRVGRVPRVLAHLGRRPEVPAATGVTVVREHLARLGASAEVTASRGVVRVEWQPESFPAVTIVIPTRHNRAQIEGCLRTLATTDYPTFEVVIVDNGERTAANEQWYVENFPDLALRVEWWAQPFNYSAVNNTGAAAASGEVLVFLNDDTEILDAGWLREMVGWAVQPGIGLVGAQLVDGDGRIQHAGVILGLTGFADHVFQGMLPDSQTMFGWTSWYRNVLAVTGACLAVRRSVFEQLDGFDERFELMGSDVVLGLDAVNAGMRNVCTPFAGVRHLEASTRGTDIPNADFFASYWRYQQWAIGGDPYFSPNLSIASREPALRSRFEPTSAERMSAPLGRALRVFRMSSNTDEGKMLAEMFSVTDADARAVKGLHVVNREPFEVKSINWFLPDIDSPFYGGVNTAFRLADHLARTHGVQNRFVFWAEENRPFFRSALNAAFPALADSELAFHDSSRAAVERVPAADVDIATLWATAYSVAQHEGARRKFYMIQDFEPMFYPAGTSYALAEESYRLNLYGLCNTEHMRGLYETRYGGNGMSFQPAIDPAVFHAEGRRFERTLDQVATVFVYARPGHFRNCWELASLALEGLKDRLGDRVRIVTAGSWARPDDLGSGIDHLGLLDYRATGDLYRTCDVGVALTVSEHPSYLPLELMACGVPVVAFDNPAGHWLLRDENAVLARQTVDGLRMAIERVVLDPELGRTLARQGLSDIAERYSSWEKSLSGVFEYLCNPEQV
jgi:GT2 family glycosyltransferase/glycosyltransferase involved in cell wall biosynthesis